jgi:hypothetical protein
MRIRTRLAVFWCLIAAMAAWLALANLLRFPGGEIVIHSPAGWFLRFTPGISDVLIAAGLLFAAVLAWTGRGARLFAYAAPRAGPPVFCLLLCFVFWPLLRGLLNPAGILPLLLLGLIIAVCARLTRSTPIKAQALRHAVVNATATHPCWAIGISSFLVLLAIHARIFRGEPAFADSVSQLIQGIILASGHLKWPEWEYPLFFLAPGMIVEGGWFSQFPPGHCILLAMGWLIHAPWIVGPLTGALAAVAVYDCGRLLYGARGGAIAFLFFVCNPWWPLMSASHMNHASTQLWLALSLCWTIRAMRDGNSIIAFGAGFAFGWAASTRPLTAAAMGIPIVIAALIYWTRTRPPRWTVIASATTGFAIWMALFMAYNRGTTGHPLLTGYGMNLGVEMSLGFGGESGHTPDAALRAALSHFVHYRSWIPVAAPGLMLPLVWTLLFAPIGWREILLLAQLLAVWGAYLFYPWHDLALGPRFQYETIIPYSLLAAGGLLGAGKRLRNWLAARGQPAPRLWGACKWLVAGLCIASLSGLPGKADGIYGVHKARREFVSRQRTQFSDPRDVVFVAITRDFDPMFVDTALHPGGPLFLENLGDKWNRRLMELMPDRQFHFATYYQAYPYEEAAASGLVDATPAAHFIQSILPEEFSSRFHKPQGRPLPEPSAGQSKGAF